MIKTTMRGWKSATGSALTKTRLVNVSLVRYGPQSLSWHSPAAVADSQTTTTTDNVDISDECPASTRGNWLTTTQRTRPMSELDGPTGWPIVGNFLTYLKKENRGQMHIVQVRHTSISRGK